VLRLLWIRESLLEASGDLHERIDVLRAVVIAISAI
jgi:hypothetical protein